MAYPQEQSDVIRYEGLDAPSYRDVEAVAKRLSEVVAERERLAKAVAMTAEAVSSLEGRLGAYLRNPPQAGSPEVDPQEAPMTAAASDLRNIACRAEEVSRQVHRLIENFEG